MFRHARTRLTVLLVMLFVVLYVVTAGTIYVLMKHLTVDDEDSFLSSNAKPLASHVLYSLNHGQFPQEFVNLKHLESLYPKMSAIVLRDALGHVLVNTNPDLVSKTIPYTYTMSQQTVRSSKNDTWLRVLTIHFSNQYHQTEGYLQMVLDVSHDVNSLNRLRHVLILVGVGGTIAASLTGFYVSHRALQPIQYSWERQQRFVADASHELRTPLTVIQSNLDVVFGHAEQSVLDNLEWLSAVKGEARRLAKLTEDLLTLARADSKETAMQSKPVDLSSVVRSVEESMGLLAEAKGISLEVIVNSQTARNLGHSLRSVSRPFCVQGDPDRLYQLVAILVDNAIKYTQAGGSVKLLLERRRNVVRLQVQDTGMGIAKEDLGRIFERFYRADEARERAKGGTGLGLSIAKWIAQMHRGRLWAKSKLGSGSTFTVSLPV